MKIRRVICPTDFSEASYRGLVCAEDIAPGESEIILVHVESAASGREAFSNRTLHAENAAHRRAEAVKNLCMVIETHMSAAVRVWPMLRQGEAAVEIVRAAREEAADLIVLTTHGAGQDLPEYLGRVAAEVIGNSPCPVLVVNATSGMGEGPLLPVHLTDSSPWSPGRQMATEYIVQY